MEKNKQHEMSALSSGVLSGCLGVIGGMVGTYGFLRFIDAISTAHFGGILQGILLNPVNSLTAAGLVALGGFLIAKAASTVINKKKEINKRNNENRKAKVNSRDKLVERVSIEPNRDVTQTQAKTKKEELIR